MHQQETHTFNTINRLYLTHKVKQKFAENNSIDIATTTETKELTEKVEKKVVAEIKTEVKEKAEAN